MKEEIWKVAQEIKDELIAIRRHIHMYPEIGYEEVETSKFVINKLEEMGIEYKSGVAKFGIIGIIRGLSGAGPTIGIRADMDALALQEENDVPYKSKINGRMHACGHDAHTAILLGVAKVLNQFKEKMKGNVKLFFQPAEESVGGAKPMVEDGALNDPPVSAVISLHVDDSHQIGTIGTKDGSFTASSDEFHISIQGKGGHAAYPHETIDPIMVGANLINSLQTISSRYTKPVYPVVVTVGSFHAGSAHNIIPETAHLTGTIRALTPEVRSQTHLHLKRIIDGIAAAFGAQIELDLRLGYSPGLNDSKLNALIKESAAEFLDEKNIITEEYPEMGAEDFFEFSDNYRIPVAMFWLGVGNKEKGIIHPGHNPKFDIDEDGLPIGCAILVSTALKYLNINNG